MNKIYIFMDDSGKLNRNEDILTYGGLIFTSEKAKDSFVRKYRSILKEIKCKYCEHDKNTCLKNCKEIKSININNSDRRRIINLCKKELMFSLIINNQNVFDSIMADKASKGRYIDYVLKINIKRIIIKLINENIINDTDDIMLIINIDEQTTKSNGYYSLKDSIKEELIHGISNYNYGTRTKPILFGNLVVSVNYLDSSKSSIIQASDIIAGTIRRLCINENDVIKRYNKIYEMCWIYEIFP